MDSLAEKTYVKDQNLCSLSKSFTHSNTFILQQNFITGIFNFVGKQKAFLSKYLEPLVFEFCFEDLVTMYYMHSLFLSDWKILIPT